MTLTFALWLLLVGAVTVMLILALFLYGIAYLDDDERVP
jgi:hypothetical protein